MFLRHTISNDCVEILQVLGIEACRWARVFFYQILIAFRRRASLLNEIRRVISFYEVDANAVVVTFSTDGVQVYVNYRHLALLVDCMTFRG